MFRKKFYVEKSNFLSGGGGGWEGRWRREWPSNHSPRNDCTNGFWRRTLTSLTCWSDLSLNNHPPSRTYMIPFSPFPFFLSRVYLTGDRGYKEGVPETFVHLVSFITGRGVNQRYFFYRFPSGTCGVGPSTLRRRWSGPPVTTPLVPSNDEKESIWDFNLNVLG